MIFAESTVTSQAYIMLAQPTKYLKSETGLAILAVAFITGSIWFFKRRLYQRRTLPPGPSGYPIIGNILDISRKESWLTLTEWGERYGDATITTQSRVFIVTIGPICFAKAFGRPYLILSSFEAITDLLEKRSSNYSDRPPSVMIYDEYATRRSDRIWLA